MDIRAHLEVALSHRYRIGEVLGEGGMAVVYQAQDLKHGRMVAIKVLNPDRASGAGTERFSREIEIASRLNHPNILGLHDSGHTDGLHYFIMPLVEGESLRTRMGTDSRLSLKEAVRITLEVGDALAYAHAQGLVHRDVKPENVLFQAGHALVCDFGIAQAASHASERLTGIGMAVGTFPYMSPEQLMGEETLDERSDVYALGCLLHEMLSGEPPFDAPNPQAALARKLSGQVPDLTGIRSDVPHTIQAVVERALAVDLQARYSTAEHFTTALEEATTAAAVEEDTRRRYRRTRLRSALTALGATVVGLVGWWLSTLLGGQRIDLIAVLPLTNQENDPAEEFYVAGMYQDLVLELAKAGLRVINHTSTDRYADSDLSYREIAEELHVDGIIQGRADIGIDRIGIELTLVDPETSEILWTDAFSEPRPRVKYLFQEVTKAVAENTGAELSQGVLDRLATTQEVNPQVYDALLQARFFARDLTRAGIDRAESYVDLALSIDSLSAEAWIAKAGVPLLRAQMGYMAGDLARQEARPALDRAAEIDPSLSTIQAEIAGLYVWLEWNWSDGEQAFLRALEDDPTDAQTRAGYSHLLLYLNRDEEALEMTKEAARLDPFASKTQAFYAMALNFTRQYEAAESVLLPVLEREPDAPLAITTMRTTYHLLGRFEDAMRMWRDFYSTEGDEETLAALSRGYEEGGYSAALTAVAELFEHRAATTDEYVRPWLIATLYTRAGVLDRALDYLEVAFEEHDQNMPYISIDPIFDPIRHEPRFRALMERLGLPE